MNTSQEDEDNKKVKLRSIRFRSFTFDFIIIVDNKSYSITSTERFTLMLPRVALEYGQKSCAS